MRFALLICWCALLFELGVCAGCGSWQNVSLSHSPLAQLQNRADEIELEVLLLKLPEHDPLCGSELWKHFDELVLPMELRARLSQEGFRVGVLNGAVPPDLGKALKLGESANQLQQELKASQLAEDSAVTLRVLHRQSGDPAEIVTIGNIAELPLLVGGDGSVSGQVLRQAEPRLVIRPIAGSDKEIKLEITPKIEYGQARSRFVGDEGIMRLDSTRPTYALPQLKCSVPLHPGEMILLTCTEDSTGGVGHQFFTQSQNDEKYHKLVFIRLAHGSAKPFFNEPETAANE